jgi:hypothetical protein
MQGLIRYATLSFENQFYIYDNFVGLTHVFR